MCLTRRIVCLTTRAASTESRQCRRSSVGQKEMTVGLSFMDHASERVHGPPMRRVHAICSVGCSNDHGITHFEKTGGRRLEGSTVDDLGRGLDVPPGSRVCVRVHGCGPGQGRSPHDCRGCGSEDRLHGGLSRAVESCGARRSRETPPWHDASSDAAPTGGPDGNNSIEPSNCSAPCPASRFRP